MFSSNSSQVSADVNYIEDVFSTYLYTGTGASLTITNNIDLSTKGGMVWIKDRTSAYGGQIYDTVRGAGLRIGSYGAFEQQSYSALGLDAFTSSGFSLGADTSIGVNRSGDNTVSWTFQEQAKFFDVVTWTGDGTSGRAISHSLASTPGCILVKRLDGGADDWAVYHTSLGTSQRLYLNTTDIPTGATAVTAVSSSTFTVNQANNFNFSGLKYVAYLFAHDAGGFGLTGTDNVISCGSFTTDGSSNFSATLGYEPQWVMIKRYNTTGNWLMFDNMRGMGVQGTSYTLYADVTNAEAGPNNSMAVNSTGISGTLGASQSYIYIAIRRGPMKVPTLGTSVFSPAAVTPTSGSAFTVGFPFDATLFGQRDGADSGNWTFEDRLRGFAGNSTSSVLQLRTSSTAAEITTGSGSLAYYSPNNTGATYGPYYSGVSTIFEFLRRAPSFFDVVCVAGGAGVTNHNLGVVPELIISKRRNASEIWIVTVQNGSSTSWWQFQGIDTGAGFDDGNLSSYVTSSTFNAGVFNYDTAGGTYVDYLFATCAGVSKVGKYTGNGTTQTIDCGFGAGGARFVLIKRTGVTGDWYVYDTARGMTVLTDPYLFLNSTAAEVATLGSVTTVSTGFALNSAILAAINVNAGTYIFLAIA